MTLASKVFVAWDLSLNWLRDTPPGLLLFKPLVPLEKKALAVEVHDNHIHLQAKTRSARPLCQILDTGADYNALNARLSDELEVKHIIEIGLSGAGTGEDSQSPSAQDLYRSAERRDHPHSAGRA